MYVIHNNSRNLHMFARSCSFCIAEKREPKKMGDEKKGNQVGKGNKGKGNKGKGKKKRNEVYNRKCNRMIDRVRSFLVTFVFIQSLI